MSGIPAVEPRNQSLHGGLESALAEALDVKAACAAVVDHLAAAPDLMPSLYLERGGRLRCQAVSGYWQVFDGMPPGAGVIGRTFVSGRPTVVSDASKSSEYLEAVPGVHAEVCVPIRLEGRLAGALNVESERPLPGAEMVRRLEGCCRLLEARIGALGGIPDESPTRALARHAAQLARLTEIEAIHEEVLAACCAVGKMDSAAIADKVARGFRVVAASGAQEADLRALPPRVLSEVAAWVGSMTSVHTIGQPAGRGFAGHEALRGAGAEALIALPLGSSDDPTGFLLLTDASPIAPPTEDIELLELLAVMTTSALTTANAVDELRRRADHDPLTGLAHHATFRAALGKACSGPSGDEHLALLVVDVDGFKRVNDERGHQHGDQVLTGVAATLQRSLRSDALLARIGGDEFAALVRVPEPDDARDVAERLRAAVARGSGPRVSVGVALHRPPEDETPLFTRADAAMYRVKRRGGDGVAMG
jgi:diguanylate cyclase (GGDEF)-like protein